MEIILIIRMIGMMTLTQPQKENLTACALYGQQKRENPDLMKRFKYCKTKLKIKG
jgi:hypothetical protein